MKRAAFLDRDGVINRPAPKGEYITQWAEVEFLPSVAEAISLLNRSGYLVFIATNQRCVAKGLITMDDVNALAPPDVYCAVSGRSENSTRSTAARMICIPRATAASRPLACCWKQRMSMKLPSQHPG